MGEMTKYDIVEFFNIFYSLFMCQDEDENETENESFRSFQIMPVTNEPSP